MLLLLLRGVLANRVAIPAETNNEWEKHMNVAGSWLPQVYLRFHTWGPLDYLDGTLQIVDNEALLRDQFDLGS